MISCERESRRKRGGEKKKERGRERIRRGA